MKRVLFLLFAAITLSGCVHDAPDYVDFVTGESYNETGFYVIREGDIDLNNMTLYDKFAEMAGESTKATYSNLISSVSGILSTVVSGKVHQVVGTYQSTDLNGNPIMLSGKIIYPKKRDIKNILIVSHYTIGANSECPSESFSFESIYAALGYAVIIPDYIGYGVSRDVIHPYLQSNTTASNVIDMAIVARNYLNETGHKAADDSVILVGYSQGGATTMHVQRLMETDSRYVGKFKIKKNYAGSGPYNIAKTYDVSIELDVTGIPTAVPMIIQGMSIGLATPLDMNYFFQEPLRSNYDNWINSKNYTIAEMNALIGSNKLSEILTPEATDRSNPETARFYKELIVNSIPEEWIPKADLYMFHSEDDGTVPFANSQLFQKQIRNSKTNIEFDFGHYGNHQQGAMKFILKVADLLD